MIKKYMSLIVTLILSLSIIGCSQNNVDKNQQNSKQVEVNKINYMEEGNVALSKGDITKALENFNKVNLKEITDEQKLHLSFIYREYAEFDKAQIVIDSLEDQSLKDQFKDAVKNARLEYKEKQFLYTNAEDIINKFLKVENDYIIKMESKTIKPKDRTLYNELLSNLSIDSPMRTSFKLIQDSGKMSIERLYRNISAQYDEVKEINLESDKKANIKCDRYFTYSQSDISGFFLWRVEYELVRDGEKWLINDFYFKEKPIIIEGYRKLNEFSINDKYKGVIEEVIKNTFWKDGKIKSTNYVEYEVKGKKEGYITSVITNEDKVCIWTSLIIPNQNRFKMKDMKSIEIDDRYILSNAVLFPIKSTTLVDKETFLSLYDKVRDVLIAEKPTDKLFSDKSPIITTILNKDNTYYVVYYDRYNVTGNCADFNIAEFIKNGDLLELKSNSSSGRDLYK